MASSALPPLSRPILPAASTARDLAWERIADWLLGPGLSIVLIVLAAFVARWLAHRLIATAVAGIVREKRPRAATAETEAAQAEAEASLTGVDAGVGISPDGIDLHGSTTPVAPGERPRPGPVPTDQLPVVRRHARLAARALEGQFLNPERQRQRVETLGSVLRSFATIVIMTIAAMMIGDQLGLNMGPVLASAGVGGVALGFGAQSLVKDFLTGIFMLAEDQYGVGDFVDVGVTSGTVEEVSLRVTRLRDPNGVIWYVRNGEIVRVANKSQGWSTAMVDVPVAYDESPERVIEVLTSAMHQLDEDEEWEDILMEEPRVVGVESITETTMSVRILAKCAPNEHWGAQREIRERALTALAREGIRGPVAGPYAGGPGVRA